MVSALLLTTMNFVLTMIGFVLRMMDLLCFREAERIAVEEEAARVAAEASKRVKMRNSALKTRNFV